MTDYLATKKDELELKSFSELAKLNFIIPSQQRGYKWSANNVKELIYDLWEFITGPKTKKLYCLQPLALVKQGDNYIVLDGQQRLTTLFLLYKYLSGNIHYNLIYKRDDGISEKGFNRNDFLNNIKLDDNLEEMAKKQIDLYYIYSAYKTISDTFSPNNIHSFRDSNNNMDYVKKSMRNFLESNTNERSVKVIWYVVDKNKQYETFRNLNSGKISLTNTELIKSLFLNRVSGLQSGSREITATQFEEMQQMMMKDNFWNMISSDEPDFPRTRMDLLFNLVARVSENDYNRDFRTSFRWFADNSFGSLPSKWAEVRHIFLRLVDIYNDIYCYHYLGFLTYCRTGDRYYLIQDVLEANKKLTKDEFILFLRKRIRYVINPNNSLNLSDFAYGSSSQKQLRRLFLLHNIESIIDHYKTLKESNEIHLQHEYERFPFELLYKQNWDIEHIASQTDSNFSKRDDMEDWLASVRSDFPEYFDFPVSELREELAKEKPSLKAYIKKFSNDFNTTGKTDDFMNLYNSIITYSDSLSKDSIKEDNKNELGNLVLLDSHTNRSFHNSLFPRKRRIILIANGLSIIGKDKEDVRQVYIPPCTFKCFTKAYSTDSDTKLNAWLQRDAVSYYKDIEQKLCDSEKTSHDKYLNK